MENALLLLPLVLTTNIYLYEHHVILSVFCSLLKCLVVAAFNAPLLIVSSVVFVLLLMESGAVTWIRKKKIRMIEVGNNLDGELIDKRTVTVQKIVFNDCNNNQQNKKTEEKWKQIANGRTVPNISKQNLSTDTFGNIDEVLVLFMLSEVMFMLGHVYGSSFLPWLLYKFIVRTLTIVLWLPLSFVISTIFTHPFIALCVCTCTLDYLETHHVKEEDMKSWSPRDCDDARNHQKNSESGGKLEMIKVSRKDATNQRGVFKDNVLKSFPILQDASGVVMTVVLILSNSCGMILLYDKWFLPRLVLRFVEFVVHIIFSYPIIGICSAGFALKMYEKGNEIVPTKILIIENKIEERKQISRKLDMKLIQQKHNARSVYYKKHEVISTIMFTCGYVGLLQDHLLLPLLICECLAHMVCVVCISLLPMLLLGVCYKFHLRRSQRCEADKRLQRCEAEELSSVALISTAKPKVELVTNSEVDYEDEGQTLILNDYTSDETKLREISEMINELDVILEEEDNKDEELYDLGIDDAAEIFNNPVDQATVNIIDDYHQPVESRKKLVFERIIVEDPCFPELQATPQIPNIVQNETEIEPVRSSVFNNISDEKFQISEQLFQKSSSLSNCAQNPSEENDKNTVSEENRTPCNDEHLVDDSEEYCVCESGGKMEDARSKTTPISLTFTENVDKNSQLSEQFLQSTHANLDLEIASPQSGLSSWMWTKKSLVFRNVPRLFTRMRRRMNVRSLSLENIIVTQDDDEDEVD